MENTPPSTTVEEKNLIPYVTRLIVKAKSLTVAADRYKRKKVSCCLITWWLRGERGSSLVCARLPLVTIWLILVGSAALLSSRYFLLWAKHDTSITSSV